MGEALFLLPEIIVPSVRHYCAFNNMIIQSEYDEYIDTDFMFIWVVQIELLDWILNDMNI